MGRPSQKVIDALEMDKYLRTYISIFGEEFVDWLMNSLDVRLLEVALKDGPEEQHGAIMLCMGHAYNAGKNK